jgi:predicted nucleic acid-binding protein
MPLVVDASFAAAWFLPDAASAETDAVARRLAAERALVPSLFWHEMRDLLLMAHRRGRLSEETLFLQLSKLERFPLVDGGPIDSAEIARLAIRHRLSAYDAAYLALALRERAPLATLDKLLATAAKAEGASLLGPLAA